MNHEQKYLLWDFMLAMWWLVIGAFFHFILHTSIIIFYAFLCGLWFYQSLTNRTVFFTMERTMGRLEGKIKCLEKMKKGLMKVI